MIDLLVLGTAATVTGLLVFYKPLAGSDTWLATVTPLASIMGSGFLVCAPLLAKTVGVYAAPAMALLLLLAYAVGSALRFNIRHTEALLSGGEAPVHVADTDLTDHRLFHAHRDRVAWMQSISGMKVLKGLEALSQVLLAVAYLISVTYYLELQAVFVLDGITGSTPSDTAASTMSTVVLSTIAVVGAVWGLSFLEKVERYVVGLNLGMIAALLVGLLASNVGDAWAGTWTLPDIAPEADPVHIARVLLGLLIVVQGFETSLYLGSTHAGPERARTMRWAQWIASAVYLLFLALATRFFADLGGEDGGVTAVVGMSGQVATVLPPLLIIAAAGSQLSAAVADDSGCGGLIGQLLGDRIASRWIYLGIGVITIGLTWITDVTGIIAIASRAFAAYYAVQCLIASLAAARAPEVGHRGLRLVAYALLALICVAVAVLGISAD